MSFIPLPTEIPSHVLSVRGAAEDQSGDLQRLDGWLLDHTYVSITNDFVSTEGWFQIPSEVQLRTTAQQMGLDFDELLLRASAHLQSSVELRPDEIVVSTEEIVEWLGDGNVRMP